MKKPSKKEVLSDSIRFFENHSALFNNANTSKKFIQKAIEEHPELKEHLECHFNAPIKPEELELPFLDEHASFMPFESVDPVVRDAENNIVCELTGPTTSFSEFCLRLIDLQNEHFEVRSVTNPVEHEQDLKGQKELAMRSGKNLKKGTFVGFFGGIVPSPTFYECFLKVIMRILTNNAKKYQHEMFVQSVGGSSPKDIHGLSIFNACNTARKPNGKPDEHRNNLDCVYVLLKTRDQFVYLVPGLITTRDVMQNESLCYDYPLTSWRFKERNGWVASLIKLFSGSG